jgi:succinate-acetate transporter protein
MQDEISADPARSTPLPSTMANRATAGSKYEVQYFDSKPYAAGTLVKQLGNPTPLGLCVFSTTITSLSFFLMEFRSVTIPNVLIGNFFFLAGLGLLIAGQWEILIGNTFGFVVFCSFGGFCLSFGAILGPTFGVAEAYVNNMDQYYNGLGLYLLGYCILLFVFTIAALRTNVVFVGVFVAALVTLSFLVASYFCAGSGDMQNFTRLRKVGGACAFVTGLLGWYLIFVQLFLCNGFDITLPVGDLSHKWCKKQQQQQQHQLQEQQRQLQEQQQRQHEYQQQFLQQSSQPHLPGQYGTAHQ